MCQAFRVQMGVALNDDMLASLPQEEQDFWNDFLQYAKDVISQKKAAGEEQPYVPTSRLQEEFDRAVREFGGDRYCQIHQLKKIFDFQTENKRDDGMERKEELWKEFLSLKPKSKNLADVVRYCPKFREEAGEMLCDWHPNYAEEQDMYPVMMFCSSDLKEFAARRLLAVANTSRNGLRCIISNVLLFKLDAAQRLLRGDYFAEDLDFIADNVPELQKTVFCLKTRPIEVVFEDMKKL